MNKILAVIAGLALLVFWIAFSADIIINGGLSAFQIIGFGAASVFIAISALAVWRMVYGELKK